MAGPTGPILVLLVTGEIDVGTLADLQHALTAALDQRPAHLVIDMTAVTYCCARGYRVLADTAATAQTHGTSYALSGLHPHLQRIVTQLLNWHHCVLYRSTAAAVSAAHTADAPAHARAAATRGPA